MAKTLYRALLPSGRGVRFKRLSTRDYLAINQRVAAKVGDKKDPGGGLARTLAPVEIVATCLVAITPAPQPWTYRDAAAPEPADSANEAEAAPAPSELDVDAMLDHADKSNAWTPVTYGDLMRREGDLSFDELFGDLADFEAMVAFATGLGREDPTKGQNLLGKVQAVSVG